MTAPFYRHNLSISEALARGGVKGGPIPGIVTDVQPVMVLADFSQTYSGEPLEGRGMTVVDTTNILNAGPASRAFWRLESIAPGGLVIEGMDSQASGSPSSTVFFDIIPTESLFAREEFEVEVLPVGGRGIGSRHFGGRATTAVTGSGPWNFTAFGVPVGRDMRVFVPTGSNFVSMAATLSPGGVGSIRSMLFFREIPQAIGLP